MTKIILFIDGLDSGGAQRQMVGLANILKKNGEEVKLVTYKKGAHFYDSILKEKGIDHKDYSNYGLLGGIAGLSKTIIEFEPHVIISFLNQPNFISCILKFFWKGILIVSERNTTVKARFLDKLRIFLYRKADAIVPNSYSQRSFLVEYNPKLLVKTVTIVNFVDINRFKPLLNRNEGNVLRVVTIARVVPQKNTIRYIRAVKEVVEKGIENIRISWYGDLSDKKYVDQCKEEIRELELDNFFAFEGETKDVVSEYQKASAFCLPSLFEGTPNVICEAMSCGLPILCSNVCDNSIYVKDGKNGFLFDPFNVNSISKALLHFVHTTAEERFAFSKRSVEVANCQFSEKKFIKEWANLIYSIKNEKGR